MDDLSLQGMRYGLHPPCHSGEKKKRKFNKERKKKFTGKRFINMLLVLCMLLSVVPSHASTALEVMPLR
jgi:hypothetical protein